MKQRFEIEVEVGERISAYKLGLMIHSLEGIGGCYAKEVFIGYEHATKELLHKYDMLRTAVTGNSYGVKNSPFSELYPKISTELNKIRRELIIKALEEVLPGFFNEEKYEKNRTEYARELAEELKSENISIRHFKTEGGELPSDICCVYHNETPIHFFNYL